MAKLFKQCFAVYLALYRRSVSLFWPTQYTTVTRERSISFGTRRMRPKIFQNLYISKTYNLPLSHEPETNVTSL